MLPSPSLFDRLFSHKSPAWLILLVSGLLLLLPFGIAFLDGVLPDVLQKGYWRALFLPPAIILYIWLVSPLISRVWADVIRAIQSYTSLDDESLAAVLKAASYIHPLHEGLVFSSGFIFGLFSAQSVGLYQNAPLLRIYWFVSNGLMFGILFMTIFVSVASTRVNAALHRQPFQIDIFDQSPFEAIGRWSLLLALVFVGGITISILFSVEMDNLFSLEAWLVKLVLILVTVLIFFLSMYPTHKVLAQAKKSELDLVQKHIYKTFRDLLKQSDENQPIGDLSTQINTLALYEQRLQAVRTWPYNTSMLRTLFFSVLFPLLTALVRKVSEALFQ